MRKIIYVVIDSPAQPAGKFPPCLNKLFLSGKSGSLKPLSREGEVESGSAMSSLLGYDPHRYPTLRGPLEAFACGIRLAQGEVALRANFACLAEDQKTIKDRKAGNDLSDPEAAALAREINAQVSLSTAGFEFISTASHRGILILRGMHYKLSGKVTNTDPAYRRSGDFELKCQGFTGILQESAPLPGFEDSLEAKETALLLNEFTGKASQVLNASAINKKRLAQNQLPANAVLLRGAGDQLIQPPLLGALYNLKFAFLARTPLERAIAGLSGMEFVDLPSLTGHADVDYSVYAKIALDSLSRCDCVFVRIKAGKETIPDADKYFFGGLLQGLDLTQTLVVVVSHYSRLIVSGDRAKSRGSWEGIGYLQLMPRLVKASATG